MFDRLLNMPQVLNMDFEYGTVVYKRVTQGSHMSEYGSYASIMPECIHTSIYLNVPQYV